MSSVSGSIRAIKKDIAEEGKYQKLCGAGHSNIGLSRHKSVT